MINRVTFKNARVQYVAGLFVILILPLFAYYWFSRDARDMFYERVNEDRDICLERATRDKIPSEFCMQAATQSKTAFTSAVQPSDTTFFLLLGLNFALYSAVLGLREQIIELKAKSDV